MFPYYIKGLYNLKTAYTWGHQKKNLLTYIPPGGGEVFFSLKKKFITVYTYMYIM
jgi:hypothetical protein